MLHQALNRRIALALLAGLSLALAARADRQEIYGLVSVGPSLTVLRDPQAGTASTPRLGATLSAAAYYGISDTLHLGVVGRVTSSKNFQFDGMTIAESSGPTTGSVYESLLTLGGAMLAEYRWNTSSHLAPIGRTELGFGFQRYSNRILVPDGRKVAFSLADSSDQGVDLSAMAGLQYRLGDHVLAEGGFAVGRSFGGRATWRFDLPLTVGWIF